MSPSSTNTETETVTEIDTEIEAKTETKTYTETESETDLEIVWLMPCSIPRPMFSDAPLSHAAVCLAMHR
jgi:hypothetical protein